MVKLAKKSLGYALAFTAGTIVSGSVAVAATTYVQAQKKNTTIQYQGTTVTKPLGLVYGGTTYVQLYSIELGLQQAGFIPTWDGYNFNFTKNDAANLSGGTSDINGVQDDIGYSIAVMATDMVDFDKVLNVQPAPSPRQVDDTVSRIVASINSNVTALQKDNPTDPALVTVQQEYLKSITELSAAFSEFDDAYQNLNDAEEQKFETDFNQALADYKKAYDDYDAYTPPNTSTSSPFHGLLKSVNLHRFVK